MVSLSVTQSVFLICIRVIIRTQERINDLGYYCVSSVLCVSNNEQNSSDLLRLIQAGKTHFQPAEKV